MKIPMTPAGIEPVTFRFVAHHLNHCATADRTSKANFTPYSMFIRTLHKHAMNWE